MTRVNFFSLLLIISAIMFLPVTTKAQVTIGSTATPQSFSVLELFSNETMGFRLPQLTERQRNDMGVQYLTGNDSIAAMGLQIFNTCNRCVETWNGREWISLCDGDDPCYGLSNSYNMCVGQTLADVNRRVQWFSAATGGNPLPLSTPLTLGTTTFYVGNCFGVAGRRAVSIRVDNCFELATSCAITPSVGNTVFTAAVYEFFDGPVTYRFIVHGGTPNQRIIEQSSNVLTLSEAVFSTAVSVQRLFPESFSRPSFAERMVRVEGGTFDYTSGTQASQPTGTNASTHAGTPTTVPSFYIARTSVTQAQYAAVMGVNPALFQCDFVTVGQFLTYSSPVETVTWFHAIAFANRLSLLEGRTPVYSVVIGGHEVDWLNITHSYVGASISANLAAWNAVTQDLSANGFRLPLCAEWEFAARGGNYSPRNLSGGTVFDYFFSNGNAESNVWFRGNPATGNRTHPVGQFVPNALGLYDMSGNVWEWTWNWWGTSSDTNSLAGPATGSFRMLRGSDWSNDLDFLTVFTRINASPTLDSHTMGFRLAASAVE